MSPSRLRHFIGWTQIAGGSWGALASYRLYSQLHGRYLLLAVAFTLFFTLVGAAGVFLVRNQSWGVPLSLLVQGMLLPIVLTPGPSYYATGGLGLEFTADTAWNLGFQVFLGTQFHYSWQSDRTVTTFGVNLVAAFLLYLLVFKVEEPSSSHSMVRNGAA